MKTKITLSNLGLEKEPTNSTFSLGTQKSASTKAKYQQSKTSLTIQLLRLLTDKVRQHTRVAPVKISR